MPNSYYTGKVHQGPSTVATVFHNTARNDDFLMDEKDIHDYIGLSEGEDKEMYIDALSAVQEHKINHGEEPLYKPYNEWEIE